MEDLNEFQPSGLAAGVTVKADAKNSSIIFERVEDAQIGEAGTSGPKSQQERHPAGAEFHTDGPAYYTTSVSQQTTLGNIGLRPTNPLLQRPEFEASLSAERTAADKPLFDENPNTIFSIRPKLLAGRYTWVDSDGIQVAVGEQKGSQRLLDVTVSMRDSLVGILSSPRAMERLTPSEGLLGYGNMSKTGKRAGALGSLAGAG
ncbi:hypothetical protein LA080_014145 [Diaporthe eres]|nr:hypothetical protein LA080_014145 [Diaporthe eres]